MRTRALNVKLLTLVLGLGVMLGGAFYLVDRFQLSRTARGLLIEADHSAKAIGDCGESEQALERYLAIRPHELAALARYGLVLDRRGTNPRTRLQAILALEQLLRHDPGRRDVRRRLVDVAMGLGRYGEARTHREVLREPAPGRGSGERLSCPGGSLGLMMSRFPGPILVASGASAATHGNGVCAASGVARGSSRGGTVPMVTLQVNTFGTTGSASWTCRPPCW
jgi:hypothetical protein